MPLIGIAVNSSQLHVTRYKLSCTYTVSGWAKFIEWLYVEPRALIAGHIQRHPHRVLLQQRRQPLVHRQKLVALDMQQLDDAAVVDARTQQLLVLHLVLLLLQLRSMLHRIIASVQWTTSLRTILDRTYPAQWFSIFSLIFSFYFGSCGRLSWLNCQLSSAH